MSVHVRQVQVQQDQVVIIKFRQIDPLLAQVSGIDVQVGMGQHQFDAARGSWIVFDKQYTHSHSPDRLHGYWTGS